MQIYPISDTSIPCACEDVYCLLIYIAMSIAVYKSTLLFYYCWCTATLIDVSENELTQVLNVIFENCKLVSSTSMNPPCVYSHLTWRYRRPPLHIRWQNERSLTDTHIFICNRDAAGLFDLKNPDLILNARLTSLKSGSDVNELSTDSLIATKAVRSIHRTLYRTENNT